MTDNEKHAIAVMRDCLRRVNICYDELMFVERSPREETILGELDWMRANLPFDIELIVKA
jgi:hypothetical protein